MQSVAVRNPTMNEKHITGKTNQSWFMKQVRSQFMQTQHLLSNMYYNIIIIKKFKYY